MSDGIGERARAATDRLVARAGEVGPDVSDEEPCAVVRGLIAEGLAAFARDEVARDRAQGLAGPVGPDRLAEIRGWRAAALAVGHEWVLPAPRPGQPLDGVLRLAQGAADLLAHIEHLEGLLRDLGNDGAAGAYRAGRESLGRAVQKMYDDWYECGGVREILCPLYGLPPPPAYVSMSMVDMLLKVASGEITRRG
jgi:hypothetical protein